MISSRLPEPSEFARYLRTETVGGVILLCATAVALLWANSPLAGSYLAVRDTTIGPAALHLDLTVAQWATDGLLALFFFVVGLELKRELVVGELSRLRQALLPVAAAAGGMLVPAGLALTIGWGSPGIDQAWAIPVATDIAFALGVLALTGSALPGTARVFLLGLAVADDLGAIVIIAVLFSSGLDVLALAGAALGCLAYWWLQRRRTRAWWVYVPLAVLIWIAGSTRLRYDCSPTARAVCARPRRCSRAAPIRLASAAAGLIGAALLHRRGRVHRAVGEQS